jgi:D-3-phosphoglycerate dehydrogenase
MKLVGIGDLFVPCWAISRGFAALAQYGVQVATVEWKLDGFDQLQAINLQIEQHGSDAVEPPEAIYEAAVDAEILITHFCPVTRRLIDACPRLQIIGVLRGGYENVNFAYARERGLLVFNTPGRNAAAVADFTVGMIIAEARNIARGHHGLKNGEWIRNYPNYQHIPDLPGRTVGLIGLGEIGRKVARRLSGFDVRILGYDPYVAPLLIAPYGVQLVGLDELLTASDFVSLHARLTAETRHLIGRRELALMKPTAYLINTARAGLVDEEALYKALSEGRIAGAALDVFEKEPPGRDYPLVNLPNVTLTPHMAGGSVDAFINSPKRLAADMIHLFDRRADVCCLLNRESLAAFKPPSPASNTPSA